MKYRTMAVKKARNAAIQIYADLKWACKKKDLSGTELLHEIDKAILQVRKKVKVPEIAEEQIRLYTEMLEKLRLLAATIPTVEDTTPRASGISVGSKVAGGR